MLNILDDSELEVIVGGRGSGAGIWLPSPVSAVTGSGNFNTRTTTVVTSAELSQGNAITGDASATKAGAELENGGGALAANINLRDSGIRIGVLPA